MKETAYLVQAALISAWWIGLSTSPAFFRAFQFEEISPTAFWSFFLPDIVLIAFLSTVRVYKRADFLGYVILGAFAYAALYCCNATITTNSGYLSTSLMLAGLAYNVFLCFNSSLFRQSQATDTITNGIKTGLQIICVWTITLAAIPFVILHAFDGLTVTNQFSIVAGVVMFIGFSALGLTSAYFMVRDGEGTPLPLDQTNQLVVSGPYQFVRNPMAVAGIGQGLAIATIFYSIPLFIYALLGALIWHFVVRPFEERDMANRFGDAYLAYQAKVKCWIPRFQKA